MNDPEWKPMPSIENKIDILIVIPDGLEYDQVKQIVEQFKEGMNIMHFPPHYRILIKGENYDDRMLLKAVELQ